MDNEFLTTVITAAVAVIGAALAISAQQQSTIVAGLVAIIAAVLAYWQQKKKITIIAAYDPASAQAQTPAIVATLPVRTWKMSEATKQWLTFDATPENRTLILSQIDSAESRHEVTYQVRYNGGYYNVEYGALVGSAGNPSCKT